MTNRKNKPVIAVVPLFDDEKDSIWMLPGYMDGLAAAGAIPIILPLTIKETDYCRIKDCFDGFLLTGGHDVDPAMYGQEKKGSCGACCPERDRLETMIYRYAYADDCPVLGICRGIQLINVLMGGTLYQDLQEQFAGSMHIDHHMVPPYDRTVHGIQIAGKSPLGDLLGKKTMQVNSYHHQGIRTVGEGLEIMACADDGLTEAICVPGRRFIWGIQWHPEFIYRKDDDQRKIFQKFTDACAVYKADGCLKKAI